jgi:hypothetical protein
VDEVLGKLFINSYTAQTEKNKPLGILSFEYEDVGLVHDILLQTDIEFICEPNNSRNHNENDVMVFAMIIDNKLKTYAHKFYNAFFEEIEPKYKRKEKLNKLNQ